MKRYAIPVRAVELHSKAWKALWFISYVLLFPIAIIQIIRDILEWIVSAGIKLQGKLVHSTFKILFPNDCRELFKDDEDDEY